MSLHFYIVSGFKHLAPISLQNEKNRFASIDIETARIDTIMPQTLPHCGSGKNGAHLDIIQ